MARVDLLLVDKIVLAYLIDKTGNNGHCWPGGRTIAADLGVDKTTIFRSLGKLANLGEVTITTRGSGKVNHYEPSAKCGQLQNADSMQNADSGCPQNADTVSAKCRQKRPQNAPLSDRPIKRPSKKTHSDTPFPDLPFDLDSEAFEQTWTEYRQHRKEIKKPMTATSEQKALKKCLALGEARAIAAIEHSIANGWQGIFEDKGGNGQAQDEPDALDRYLAARRPAQ